MDVQALFTTIIATVIGGLTTWIFAWFYYIKAGAQLTAEAEQLRAQSNLQQQRLDTLIQMMENAGRDLTREAEVLRAQSSLQQQSLDALIQAMENAKWIKIHRDAKGHAIAIYPISDAEGRPLQSFSGFPIEEPPEDAPPH